jgi:hypothetical protein
MAVTIQGAESNRAQLRYIPEATWGTTPGSGITREMRITSSKLILEKETKTSDEIRADRMVPNNAEVAAASQGDVSWELSAFTHDDFFQGFLLGAWSLPMKGFQVKGTAVSITDTDEVTVAGADYRDWLTVGQYLKLEGFDGVTNNTYVSIASLAFTAGNTVITTNETTLVAEAGASYSKVMDAGDVILASTTTAFTSGNTIDGGGANAFAGKTLYVGQKIWIEGLGKETATLTFEATDPAAGDLVTIGDGVDTIIFEWNTSADAADPAHVYVPISGTEATAQDNLQAAIMDQFNKGNFRVSIRDLVAGTSSTLVNHNRTGGSVSETGGGVTVTAAFSGGSATKGGMYTIASLPDDDTIVVSETLTTDANAGSLLVVIKGSHLRNPGTVADITKQSFSIETGFTDVSQYFLMNGLRVGSFEMSVTTGEIVTGSFNFMGRETLPGVSSVLGNTGTYDVLPTTATEILNATANVGQIEKNGVALSTAVKSIELSGDASLRKQPAVGEKFPAGIGYGRFTLEGKVSAYFENLDFYNDFRNHVTVSLGFDFEDVDHNKYFFRIPAAKITTNPVAPGGIDQDVMEEMEFTAQRDPILNTQFMIDRFSSIYPFTAVA